MHLMSFVFSFTLYILPEIFFHLQAMDVEMEALEKNKTWELVSLPPNKKHIDVNEYAMWSTKQMVQLSSIKQD